MPKKRVKSRASSRRDSESVHVVVRVRPINATERRQGHKTVVSVDRHAASVAVPDTRTGGSLKTFTFDAVYGADSTQEQVYADTARPIVEGVLAGFNGTIFAYGQTGTGWCLWLDRVPREHMC